MHAGESGHGSLVHTVTLHGLPGCYLWCGPRFQRSRNEKGLADEYLLTLGTTGGEGVRFSDVQRNLEKTKKRNKNKGIRDFRCPMMSNEIPPNPVFYVG